MALSFLLNIDNTDRIMALTRPNLENILTNAAIFTDSMTVLHGGSSQANVDVGFVMNRANGLVPNAAFYWSESLQSFVVALTANAGVTASNITPTFYANVTANTLAASAVSASTVSAGTVNSTTVVASTFQYPNGQIVGSGTAVNLNVYLAKATAANTTNTLIDSVSTSGNTAVRWTLSSADNVYSNFKMSTIDAVSDGTNVYYTEYAVVQNNNSATVATFSSNVYNGSISLWAIGGSANVTVSAERVNIGAGMTVGYLNSVGPAGAAGSAGPTGATGTIANTASWIVTTNLTPSTSSTTGALEVAGGAGIGGNVYVGGALYSPTVNINSTAGLYNVLNITGAALNGYGGSQTWAFFTQNAVGGGPGNWILFPDSSYQYTAYPGTLASGISTLAISTLNAATIGNTNASLTGSSAVITGTTNSTGTSSGALQVVGGVGVGGNVYVGGNVVVTGNVISGSGNITVQSFTGNSGQFYGNAAGFTALYAGIPSGYAATPDTIIQSAGNFNSYVQNNSQNINAGSQATTDWVATASNGSDTIYYVDLGIAGGGYSNASPYNSLGTSLWPNDAYLYAQGNVAGAPGGNLVVGTSVPGTVTRILAGGVNSSNVVAIFSNTGLTVSGNVISSNVYTNGLFWAGNGNVIQTGGGGGSITYTANTAPPATGNTVGSQWYNTSTDTLYEYEYDGVTYHWVDIASPTLATNVNLISGNLTVTGNLFVQSNTASGTVTRVEYNIPHPFMLMGAT
jgi:hypothetical protein